MTLSAFIDTSSLPQEDKDLWLSILGKIDDVQIKIFEDFIEEKEENLKLLTTNMKDKARAIRDLDEKTLDSIVASEH